MFGGDISEDFLDNLETKADNFHALVDFRRAQAYNCAAQFIQGRALRPWFMYEPVGSPLAYITHSVVAPPKYCQPLIDGDEARQVDRGDLEEYKAGMARVINGSGPHRALWNENEYYVSDYVGKAGELVYRDVLVHRGIGVGAGTYEVVSPENLLTDPNPELAADLIPTNIACVVPNQPTIADIDVPE